MYHGSAQLLQYSSQRLTYRAQFACIRAAGWPLNKQTKPTVAGSQVPNGCQSAMGPGFASRTTIGSYSTPSYNFWFSRTGRQAGKVRIYMRLVWLFVSLPIHIPRSSIPQCIAGAMTDTSNLPDNRLPQRTPLTIPVHATM